MKAHNENDKKYYAFISDSHRDTASGDWLHKALETYIDERVALITHMRVAQTATVYQFTMVRMP